MTNAEPASPMPIDTEPSAARVVSLESLGDRGLLWIALGVPLGVTVDPGDSKEPSVDVRLGNRQVPLPVAVASLYSEAFVPRSDDELIQAASNYELDDAPGAIEYLRSQGLIAKVSGREMDEDVAAARVLSTAVGIGNSHEDPYAFTIMDPRSGMSLTMDTVAYAVWTCFDGRRTVSEACNRVATEFGLDPTSVRIEGAGLVLAMMHTRLAYLDP